MSCYFVVVAFLQLFFYCVLQRCCNESPILLSSIVNVKSSKLLCTPLLCHGQLQWRNWPLKPQQQFLPWFSEHLTWSEKMPWQWSFCLVNIYPVEDRLNAQEEPCNRCTQFPHIPLVMGEEGNCHWDGSKGSPCTPFSCFPLVMGLW